MSQTTLRKFLMENISTTENVNLLCYDELKKKFRVSEQVIKEEIRIIQEAEIARCRRMFKTEFYLYKCARMGNTFNDSGNSRRITNS